jgi:hypothetical protein
VDAPILCYAGRMDQPTILEGTDTSTISISVENRLSDLQRRIERRFTDRDQRLEYPADTGLAYIAWTMDWNGAWVRPASRSTFDTDRNSLAIEYLTSHFKSLCSR